MKVRFKNNQNERYSSLISGSILLSSDREGPMVDEPIDSEIVWVETKTSCWDVIDPTTLDVDSEIVVVVTALVEKALFEGKLVEPISEGSCVEGASVGEVVDLSSKNTLWEVTVTFLV